MSRRRALTASLSGLVALFGAAGPARAHDFWIAPETFRPEPGARVALHLEVGEAFEGERVPRMPERIERFVLSGPAGERDVAGAAGVDPAGVAIVPGPGVWIAGYRSRPTPIELEAAKFEAYLREEGLESVAAVRAGRNASSTPGREIYSRCAKALLVAGDPAGPSLDRALGFRLEIVLETDPLVARVEYEGHPVEGALVKAHRRGDPAVATARTDAQGRVRLPLGAAGIWLLNTVHMVPAPDRAVADWESLWASVTFQRP